MWVVRCDQQQDNCAFRCIIDVKCSKQCLLKISYSGNDASRRSEELVLTCEYYEYLLLFWLRISTLIAFSHLKVVDTTSNDMMEMY